MRGDAAGPSATIGPLLQGKRIVVCVGAGGVGKTTTAAAIAVREARAGRSVACLTIDPAKRLADSLGVDVDAGAGRLVDVTDILGSGAALAGRLSFGMLDPKSTFDDLIRSRSSSPEAAEKILGNKLYRYVSGSLSGMQEYMALERLAAIRQDPSVELIVLDTPPTANALDFFTAPRRMIDALDGPLVRVMRRAYRSATRAGFDIFGRWAAGVLNAIARVTGAELLSEMMAFIDALSDLFGSFAERARSTAEVLRGGEVAFCLVTSPERATLREARELRYRLAALGLRIDAVIFNRGHFPPADAPPSDLDPALRAEIEALNAQWNDACAKEEELIESVRRAWEGIVAVAVVPTLPEGASRIDALDRIGRSL